MKRTVDGPKRALDHGRATISTPVCDSPQPCTCYTATYILGCVEAAAPAELDVEAKHRTIMQQLRGMPMEMLHNTYNLYRIENHHVNLDEHPEYRTYQTFYEMGIAPPPHQEMASIIIEKTTTSTQN